MRQRDQGFWRHGRSFGVQEIVTRLIHSFPGKAEVDGKQGAGHRRENKRKADPVR